MLDAISNNYSQIKTNSCGNKSELFAAIFKDGKIAQALSCWSPKCGYVGNFGLAPFLKSLLAEALNDASYYLCCFDDCYNSVIKKEQLAMHV